MRLDERSQHQRKSVPAEILPSSYYRSEEIFGQEKERIFTGGFAPAEKNNCRIPAITRCSTSWEKVFWSSGPKMAASKLITMCRHRGAWLCVSDAEQLASDDAGNEGWRTGHHWYPLPLPSSGTYGLDGRLLHAPHFVEGPGFSRSDFSPYPVGAGNLGRVFSFLNLSPGEPPETYRPCRNDSAKLSPECSTTLSAISAPSKRSRTTFKPTGRPSSKTITSATTGWGLHPELCEIVPAFRQQGGAQLDWERGIPHREGSSTFTFSGTTSRAIPGFG